MIAGHAALRAIQVGKPVKSFTTVWKTWSPPPSAILPERRHRTAVSKDGKILVVNRITIDGGAYATLSSVVLSRGTIHAGGPYYWPSVRIRTKAVATNTPPHGAFRGFGAPQSYCNERHMDRIAQVVGISPIEIRRRISSNPGKHHNGQTIRENIDWNDLLDRALELSDYVAKKNVSRKKIRRECAKKGSCRPLFCMARDSPAPANAI